MEGACRLADRLMTQIPAKKEIEAAGFYQGLPAISILEPFVYLYQHTQNEKYLDFARYIVSRMEAPGLVEAYEDGKLQGPLKEIAADLEEESNPVIMIARYKNE